MYSSCPLPTTSDHVRQAVRVRAEWPTKARRQRRASVRWWWENCRLPVGVQSLAELWLVVNGGNGVIDRPLQEGPRK